MKQDFRFLKTEQAIIKAFIELLEEEGFYKLNVSTLIARAEVTRSTFYAHYTDKMDLLEKLENSILEGWKEISNQAPLAFVNSINGHWEEVDAHIYKGVKYLYTKGKLLYLLMSEKGDPAFAQKFRQMVIDVWETYDFRTKIDVPRNYLLAATTGMMSNLMIEWVKNDFQETPEEFMTIIKKMSGTVIGNIFQ